MEKINIAEILRNCPQGMELYSPLCGKCVFDRLTPYMGTIICKKQNTQEITFTKEGYYMTPVFNDCECMLFPSKDQRDWSKFQRPFKDGDIISDSLGTCIFKGEGVIQGTVDYYCGISCDRFSIQQNGHYGYIADYRLATEEEKAKLFDAIKANGYEWNEGTKTLVPKFKDGDVVAAGDGASSQLFLLKYVEYSKDYNGYDGYCYFGWDFYYNKLFEEGNWGFDRLATEEEKEKLFKAIKDNGYRWDEETKTLEKLTPKFKDGDVVAAGYSESTQLFLLKHVVHRKDGHINTGYCYFGWDFYYNRLFEEGAWGFCRLATEEEKAKLFDTIKANGYEWDEETKNLIKPIKPIKPKFKVGDKIKLKGGDEFGIITQVADCFFTIKCKNSTHYWSIKKQDDWELIPNKFDITTLIPFESKILVRDKNTDEWRGHFFSHYDNNSDRPYICIGVEGINEYKQCIPYEGNEHLLGKTDCCNDFYKNW